MGTQCQTGRCSYRPWFASMSCREQGRIADQGTVLDPGGPADVRDRPACGDDLLVHRPSREIDMIRRSTLTGALAEPTAGPVGRPGRRSHDCRPLPHGLRRQLHGHVHVARRRVARRPDHRRARARWPGRGSLLTGHTRSRWPYSRRTTPSRRRSCSPTSRHSRRAVQRVRRMLAAGAYVQAHKPALDAAGSTSHDGERYSRPPRTARTAAWIRFSTWSLTRMLDT